MRQVEVFKAVRNRKAVLPIAVVFNEAEDSPQHAPRVLVGNETSVLVDQALRRQLSRARHLSECVDGEALSLSKEGIGDQTIQAELEPAVDESPDVARLAGGLPTGFVVVGLHETVVGFVHEEIRPAKQWADSSLSQRLNILCRGIELWLQPRSRVTAQGKRPVVVMERERHATPGPKQPGCRHGSARQFDLLLPKAQAGWRWKAFPLGYAPEIHDERCCRRFLLHDFLHLATERHAVFQRAVAFGVSTRISGKEDKYVGAPQLGHGVPQMRETLGQFGLVARAENPGKVDRSEGRRTAQQFRNRLRALPSDLLPARPSRNSETEKVRRTLQGRPGESLCDPCSLAYATPAHAENLGNAIQDEWIGTYTKRHVSAVARERPRTNTCDREDAGWKLSRQNSNLRPVA